MNGVHAMEWHYQLYHQCSERAVVLQQAYKNLMFLIYI